MSPIIYIIIAAAVIGLVYLIIIFFVYLKKRQDEVEANFQQRFANKEIKIMDKTAFYVARLSDGYSHFKGNGYLVLTKDELYFERRVAKKIITISTNSIVKAEKTRRLAGKSIASMLLKVVFINKTGEEDAVAWKVRELEQWINEISGIAGNTG